jgi:hypothetical protein
VAAWWVSASFNIPIHSKAVNIVARLWMDDPSSIPDVGRGLRFYQLVETGSRGRQHVRFLWRLKQMGRHLVQTDEWSRSVVVSYPGSWVNP